MTMRKPMMLALAALLLTSACADQPTTKNAQTVTQYQQTANLRWEEMIVPPTQMARVGNQGLIMMR